MRMYENYISKVMEYMEKKLYSKKELKSIVN